MEETEEQKIKFRAIIEFLFLEGENATNIHSRLVNIYNDSAPSYRTIAYWVCEFRRGRERLRDEQRSGRPIEASSEEIIEDVRLLIEGDRRIKAHQLARAVGVSKGTIISILHEKLGLSKISARWVPRNLTPFQRAERSDKSLALLHRYQNNPAQFLQRLVTGDETWVYFWDPLSKEDSKEWRERGSKAPTKARTQRSAGKVMCTIFWDTKGPILIDYLAEGDTINGQYYADLMTRLRQAIVSKRRGKMTGGVLLLHDNAPPHKSDTAQAAINACGFEQLDHPPYSPDLAPCDYYLFRLLKRHLRGRRFQTRQALEAAVNDWLETREEDLYSRGLQELGVRWNKCFVHQGLYFEKQ